MNHQKAVLIFPHQLFANHPAVKTADVCFVIEHPLFFQQYQFHKQKLVLHRASMKHYARGLEKQGHKVRYIEAQDYTPANLAKVLQTAKAGYVQVCELVDDWLEQDIAQVVKKAGVVLEVFETPQFLTPPRLFDELAGSGKKLSMASFYIKQRKRLDILVKNGAPVGGKWSLDTENRKKLPASVTVPKVVEVKQNSVVTEAVKYVQKHFPKAYGEIEPFRYPVTREDALLWLKDFLKHRFAGFGPYEDAMSEKHDVVFHSLLSPMLNIGLLTPAEVVDQALAYADKHEVSLASLEGFIRQIIGWREFMRIAYEKQGRAMRTKNYFGFDKKLPKAFWTARTGIAPIDHTITRLLKSSYNHHIERLMMLGAFMLLCEIDPDEIYEWFMSMYIDAYDWVMVPNVYGMSQYADGGNLVTKPYICSSNYILKMSDYQKGEWCEIWDGLYWRFIKKHESVFAKNPRMSVMVMQIKRMDAQKLKRHLQVAEQFLSGLK